MQHFKRQDLTPLTLDLRHIALVLVWGRAEDGEGEALQHLGT